MASSTHQQVTSSLSSHGLFCFAGTRLSGVTDHDHNTTAAAASLKTARGNLPRRVKNELNGWKKVQRARIREERGKYPASARRMATVRQIIRLEQVVICGGPPQVNELWETLRRWQIILDSEWGEKQSRGMKGKKECF